MNASDISTENIAPTRWAWLTQPEQPQSSPLASAPVISTQPGFDLWQPLRKGLDQTEISNAKFAHLICKLIPAQCPFARDIQVFGRTLFHIPPLCKLNPVYEEVVALRFRALCYLADVCGEDITPYC